MQSGLDKQQQQQQGAAAAAGFSQPLPAVTLLAQRYVSCLQLSRLLDANPAAAAVARLVSAARPHASLSAAAAAGSKDGTSKSSSSSSFSCVLHLQAAAAAAGVRQQQDSDGMPAPAKRHKQDGAAQHTSANMQGQQLPTPHQQQQVIQPLGSALGSWLADLTCQQQQQQAADLANTFGSSGAGLLLPFIANGHQQTALALPGMPSLALLNGQVGFRLGGDSQAQLAWAARPQLPSHQQQQQQVLPVQLALQATSVPALAQLHRAVLLALLEELNGSHMGSCSGSASDVTSSSSSSSSRWLLELQQPQHLRVVLQRMKQLQQQLLLLQDVADEAMETRGVLAAAVEAAGLSAGTEAAAGSLAELQQQQVKWGHGLQAVYGQMLLAFAGSACVVCQEA
jgi:hypothetical protein